MELIKRELPRSYKAIDTADFHLGSSNCHKEGIINLVKRVKELDAIVFLKGDLFEAIIPGDKRFNLDAHDMDLKTPDDQIEWLSTQFKDIKDNIAVVLMGNHEYKIIHYRNMIKNFCEKLKLDYDKVYGGAICKFIATNGGRVMHKHLLTHGNKGLPPGAKDPIQREANRKAAQKRTLEELGFADCIYSSQGHHHQLVIVEPTCENHLYLTDDGKSIKQKYRVQSKQNIDYIPPDSRWYAGTASYRKTYCKPGSKIIDYGEGKFPPAPLGHVELEIIDGELVSVKPYLA